MSTFNKVRALRPGRSVFNLSYQKQFDCDFGELIPVTMEEMVPGDTFKVGNEIVIRFHPLNSPVLAEINAYVHYFFVPTRLIFDGWENFITGGEDGMDATVLPRYSPTLPEQVAPHSLYDYFGFPLLKSGSGASAFWNIPGGGGPAVPSNPAYYFRPLSFPWRCYNLCWNEFYRDETLQNEVSLDNSYVLKRNWHKDYFTSALPWQQRGTAPALPLSGYGNAVFDSNIYAPVLVDNDTVVSDPGTGHRAGVNSTRTGNNNQLFEFNAVTTGVPSINPVFASVAGGALSNNTIDMSNVATFDVSDLRLAFQVQKWMERNARSGVRYTSFLHAHYGVSPRDDRLQRPEYLGGSKSPILISEVVQTSESGTTPQGTLRGKGLTADKNFVCSYTAKEFGYLIGIFSVMPKPGYFQGVDRKWLRASRYDFFTPEFGHLSEQAVTTEELFAFPGTDTQSDIGNGTIFGYQARFNEMRQNHDMFCGDLRPDRTLGYWNLGRYFDSVPQLNSDFITLDASRDHLKRIFAVQDVKGLVVNFANIITAIRPIPKFGEPGLIDHN